MKGKVDARWQFRLLFRGEDYKFAYKFACPFEKKLFEKKLV